MTFNTFGLITQKNQDGGDTLARHSEARFICEVRDKVLDLHLGVAFPNESEQDMRWLEVEQSGNWIRSPEPHMWWSDPTRTSRDQVIPLVAWLGIIGDHVRLKRWMKQILERWLFCQNKTDTIFFHLPLYWRARGFWFLYPAICILDFFTIFTVLNRIGVLPRWEHEKKAWRKLDLDDVGDDRNLLIQFVQAKIKYPTPVMWLIRKIYFKYRKVNYGCYLRRVLLSYVNELRDDNIVALCKALHESNLEGARTDDPITGALLWYSRPSANGNLDQAELWRPVVQWLK